MNIDMVTRTIQLVLAPVVMVTACAILLGGLLQRYAAINDRLREMSRERLDLVFTDKTETATDTLLARERLSEIDTQIPMLLIRHQFAHHAVLLVYSAVAFQIADMVVIALAVLINTLWAAIIVLVLFLVGILLMLAGIIYTAVEVRSSHQALAFEVNRVLNLIEAPKRIQ